MRKHRVMSGKETMQPELEFVAFVGIDWADRKHVWCLQAAGSTRREYGEVEHKPETVEAWVGELCRRFGPGPIAVAAQWPQENFFESLGKCAPGLLFRARGRAR